MGKVRLITIVLAGVIVGFFAVLIQQSAVPLPDRLVSPDDGRRNAALRSLAERPDAERQDVVDRLIDEKLGASNAKVRRNALYAIRKSGVSSPRIVQAMIVGLTDEDDGVKQEARAGMTELGEEAVPAIIQVLGRQRSGRHELTTALARAVTPQTVPLLTQTLLKGNDLQVRGVVGTISMLKSPDVLEAAKETVPALARVSASTDPVTSGYATLALVKVSPTDFRAVPGLLRMVQSDWDQHHVRGYEAAEALARIPAGRERAVPVLRRLMLESKDGFADGKRYRRPHLAAQLEKMDRRGRGVTELNFDLKSRDAAIRYRAVYHLSSAPVVSAVLARALVDATADRDPAVAARAMAAIFKMGISEVAPFGATAYPKMLAALDRVTDEQAENFRVMAARGLMKAGRPLLPSVVEGVRRGTLKLETANYVLSFYEAETVPFLKALMTDQSPNVRVMAAIALARLAPTTPGIERELQRVSGLTGQAATDLQNAKARMGRSAAQ